MADQGRDLPVRTYADTDDRVQVKIVDSTTVTQQATVDTDGNVYVKGHGTDSDGANQVTKLSQDGAIINDGFYDASENKEPSNIGVIGHTRATTPAGTDQVERITSIQGTADDTVHAMDVALHDNNGDAFSETNPVPVYNTENPGTEVHDYNTTATVAASGTTDHDYSVGNGEEFLVYGFHSTSSANHKVELKIGDGAASETFTTKMVLFGSEATQNAAGDMFRVPIKVTGTVDTTTVRLTITNRDNQTQDVYSTLIGLTKA